MCKFAHAETFICVFIKAQTYIHNMHVCIYIYMCVCLYMCACVYAHTYTHILAMVIVEIWLISRVAQFIASIPKQAGKQAAAAPKRSPVGSAVVTFGLVTGQSVGKPGVHPLGIKAFGLPSSV